MASSNQNNPPQDHIKNLTIVLVSPLLIENNSHQWQQEMLVALETKNKEKFVNGSLSCSTTTSPFRMLGVTAITW